MDQDFKDYLEKKGLHQVETFNVVVPVIFGVLRESIIYYWVYPKTIVLVKSFHSACECGALADLHLHVWLFSVFES